jgi:hypothetical protein
VKRVLPLVGFLLCAAPLSARNKTDVVVMQNGDRLTGEIKKVDRDTLYLSLDHALGTVSLQWSKVAHLESRQLFIVEVEDGSVYAGAISTEPTAPGQAAAIRVAPLVGESVVVERSLIVAVDETARTFWRRLSGDVSSGVIYSKGNDSVQYNVGLDASYLRPRWLARGNLSSSLSASGGVASSTRNQGSVAYYRRLRWSRYFWTGLGSVLQSSEQQISLQGSVGGGFGRYLENTDRVRLAVTVGGAFQSTSYDASADEPRQSDAAALVAGAIDVSTFNKLSFSLDATLLPVLTDPGRVRFNTTSSFSLKVLGNLSLSLSFYGNWDNRPPPGLVGSDYGLSSGLSWTFGN